MDFWRLVHLLAHMLRVNGLLNLVDMSKHSIYICKELTWSARRRFVIRAMTRKTTLSMRSKCSCVSNYFCSYQEVHLARLLDCCNGM